MAKKKKRLTWDFATGPLDRAEIKALESEWGVKFPEDYVQCVLKNDGGSPSLMVFDFPGHPEAVFNNLLSFHDPEAEYDSDGIRETYRAVRRRLPEGVYPIAGDPFGNLICFDYRDSTDAPEVVFWDHEAPKKRAISRICATFTELLESLYEDD
jgi:hypothetical protein